MSVPYYLPWSGNLLRTATLSVVAGGDSDYPIANVVDGNPAWPAKNSGTTLRIVADLGTATPAGLAAAIHHNLGNSTVLRLQGNATNVWTAPSLDVAFPTRTGLVGGYRENALLDFRASVASYRYYSFVVPSANAVAVWFGQLWLGVPINFHDDFRTDSYSIRRMNTVLENLTYGEVSLRLNKGFVRRAVTGTIRARLQDVQQYLDLFDALSGSAEPVLVMPDPAAPIGIMALLDQADITCSMVDVDAYDISVTFRELSRGVPFPLV